jgi:hypothetical protein
MQSRPQQHRSAPLAARNLEHLASADQEQQQQQQDAAVGPAGMIWMSQAPTAMLRFACQEAVPQQRAVAWPERVQLADMDQSPARAVIWV